MRVWFAFICLVFLLPSCLNNGDEAVKGVDPEAIFHDYKISAEEGREEVTVVVQYRLGGKEGRPLLLDNPSKVSLDGTMLNPDSARLAGAFYEISIPLTSLGGKHAFVFTDSRQKEHKTEFRFEPFSLADEIPDQVRKKPLNLRLTNFPSGPTTVRLVVIDTSFATPDINEDLLVENSEIRIDDEKLANLSNGPITLEVYREEEKQLKGVSKKGGRILMTYSLRRQFEFVD